MPVNATKLQILPPCCWLHVRKGPKAQANVKLIVCKFKTLLQVHYLHQQYRFRMVSVHQVLHFSALRHLESFGQHFVELEEKQKDEEELTEGQFTGWFRTLLPWRGGSDSLRCEDFCCDLFLFTSLYVSLNLYLSLQIFSVALQQE